MACSEDASLNGDTSEPSTVDKYAPEYFRKSREMIRVWVETNTLGYFAGPQEGRVEGAPCSTCASILPHTTYSTSLSLNDTASGSWSSSEDESISTLSSRSSSAASSGSDGDSSAASSSGEARAATRATRSDRRRGAPGSPSSGSDAGGARAGFTCIGVGPWRPSYGSGDTSSLSSSGWTSASSLATTQSVGGQ